MSKYPNQKTVRIDKPEGFSTFAIYGKPDICDACEVLSYSALRVWLYLLSQKAQIQWDISPQCAENQWGIPRTSWEDGISELREKGYLDDEAIHSKSTKPLDEIRKKKRNSLNVEVRINLNEIRDNYDEFQGSNNINNTKYNNSYLNTSVEIADENPEETKTISSQDVFVF